MICLFLYPSRSLRMLSLSFSAFHAWSFSFLVGVRFFCLAAMIRRNPSMTSLSDTLTLCLSSCLRISSFANLWGGSMWKDNVKNRWWNRLHLIFKSWPASSPKELLLAGSVVCAQGFELSLSLLQLCQDLILRVPSRSGSLLRVQQPLCHQLFFDPCLQRTCMGNTGGWERQKVKRLTSGKNT